MTDILANLAYSTVATAPSPPTSGLSVTVQSGDGAKFPQSGSFNILMWPAGVQPLISNAEIARCSGVSGNTITISQRALTGSGTTAQAVAIGYQICQPIDAYLLGEIAGLNPNPTAITMVSNAATVPVTSVLSNVTNNSAAAATITMAVTGASDGQKSVVRFFDASGVAQTLTFVNTENSSISVPTASAGSTTIPRTIGFIFNVATTKWTCQGWA